jgi:O-antigen ligase
LFKTGFTQTGRFVRYSQTVEELGTSPLLGHGLASWPVVTERGDVMEYPHNLLLEIWFELGLVGLLLALGMIGWSIKGYGSVSRWRKHPYAVLALALFLFALLNAMASFDINRNEWVFLSMALLLGAMQPGFSDDQSQTALPRN